MRRELSASLKREYKENTAFISKTRKVAAVNARKDETENMEDAELPEQQSHFKPKGEEEKKAGMPQRLPMPAKHEIPQLILEAGTPSILNIIRDASEVTE